MDENFWTKWITPEVEEHPSFPTWLRAYEAANVPTVCSYGSSPGGPYHKASRWLYPEPGKPVPGGAVCLAHGIEITNEYDAKLEERWGLVPLAFHYAAEQVKKEMACEDSGDGFPRLGG